jgi:hypothetical protein
MREYDERISLPRNTQGAREAERRKLHLGTSGTRWATLPGG